MGNNSSNCLFDCVKEVKAKKKRIFLDDNPIIKEEYKDNKENTDNPNSMPPQTKSNKKAHSDENYFENSVYEFKTFENNHTHQNTSNSNFQFSNHNIINLSQVYDQIYYKDIATHNNPHRENKDIAKNNLNSKVMSNDDPLCNYKNDDKDQSLKNTNKEKINANINNIKNKCLEKAVGDFYNEDTIDSLGRLNKFKFNSDIISRIFDNNKLETNESNLSLNKIKENKLNENYDNNIINPDKKGKNNHNFQFKSNILEISSTEIKNNNISNGKVSSSITYSKKLISNKSITSGLNNKLKINNFLSQSNTEPTTVTINETNKNEEDQNSIEIITNSKSEIILKDYEEDDTMKYSQNNCNHNHNKDKEMDLIDKYKIETLNSIVLDDCYDDNKAVSNNIERNLNMNIPLTMNIYSNQTAFFRVKTNSCEKNNTNSNEAHMTFAKTNTINENINLTSASQYRKINQAKMQINDFSKLEDKATNKTNQNTKVRKIEIIENNINKNFFEINKINKNTIDTFKITEYEEEKQNYLNNNEHIEFNKDVEDNEEVSNQDKRDLDITIKNNNSNYDSNIFYSLSNDKNSTITKQEDSMMIKSIRQSNPNHDVSSFVYHDNENDFIKFISSTIKSSQIKHSMSSIEKLAGVSFNNKVFKNSNKSSLFKELCQSDNKKSTKIEKLEFNKDNIFANKESFYIFDINVYDLNQENNFNENKNKAKEQQFIKLADMLQSINVALKGFNTVNDGINDIRKNNNHMNLPDSFIKNKNIMISPELKATTIKGKEININKEEFLSKNKQITNDSLLNSTMDRNNQYNNLNTLLSVNNMTLNSNYSGYNKLKSFNSNNKLNESDDERVKALEFTTSFLSTKEISILNNNIKQFKNVYDKTDINEISICLSPINNKFKLSLHYPFHAHEYLLVSEWYYDITKNNILKCFNSYIVNKFINIIEVELDMHCLKEIKVIFMKTSHYDNNKYSNRVKRKISDDMKVKNDDKKQINDIIDFYCKALNDFLTYQNDLIDNLKEYSSDSNSKNNNQKIFKKNYPKNRAERRSQKFSYIDNEHIKNSIITSLSEFNIYKEESNSKGNRNDDSNINDNKINTTNEDTINNSEINSIASNVACYFKINRKNKLSFGFTFLLSDVRNKSLPEIKKNKEYKLHNNTTNNNNNDKRSSFPCISPPQTNRNEKNSTKKNSYVSELSKYSDAKEIKDFVKAKNINYKDNILEEDEDYVSPIKKIRMHFKEGCKSSVIYISK